MLNMSVKTMDVPLDEFEQYISETILARGLSYFRNERVQEPEELRAGEYEFIVEGSEDYNVRIKTTKGTITEYVCNCPYDMGPVCKHVVAAIFYLQNEELELGDQVKKPQRKVIKKRKTVADKVNDLLNKIPHEELKEFILEKTEREKNFRDMFIASFAHYNDGESKTFYVNQIKSILKSASDRHGFIDWSAVGYVGSSVYEVIEKAQIQLMKGNYKSAMLISQAVSEQMVEALQFSDDSNGDIGGNIEAAFEVLYKVAEENNEEKTRKQLFEYCLEAFDDELYAGWDWHIGLLELSVILIQTRNEAEQVLNRIELIDRSEYEIEAAQRIKYELLHKTEGEEAARDYLEENIANPEFRRRAIQRSIEIKDHRQAIHLAREGVEQDLEDKPGLAKEWYDWLLKIAQYQGDKERIIEYARYLFIVNFKNEQDYYQVLKDHVKSDDWNDFVDGIIEEIKTKNRWLDFHLLGSIYIREERWERLLDLIRTSQELRTIEHYEKHLSKIFPGEFAGMYSKAIVEYLDRHTGRNHYQTACRYLRRMIKFGERNLANRTISILKEKYPQRRALLEELNMI
jgi:uncharacterized Zn finger protein